MGVVHPASLSLATTTIRAEAFALRILERYASMFRGVAPVEAVLRAQPNATVANIVYMARELALRLDLVNRAFDDGPRVRKSAASAPRARVRPAGGRVRERPQSASHTIFERLFAREIRIEAVSAWERPADALARPDKEPRPPTTPIAEPSWAPPLRMVVRRE